MKNMASIFGVVALLCLPLVAFAGDWHSGASLICSDCHVMHGEQSHGYNADGSGGFTAVGGAAPYDYLLRNTANELCLTCHNGTSGIPDVLELNTGVPSDVRQAGALNRSGAAPYYLADGHTLDSIDQPPGNDGSYVPGTHGLECTNCHQPHGYHPAGNAYRNLTGFLPGGQLVSYSTNVADTVDVYISATLQYDQSVVNFGEPNPGGSAYGNWCKGCHTDFHGASGDPNMGGTGGTDWLRHPTADADIGGVGGGHSNLFVFAGKTNKAKVMNPNKVWGTTVPTDWTGSTPSCMSCHKGHGNRNAFGLIYMSGTGTITEEGDDGTVAKDLCKQCHVQG